MTAIDERSSNFSPSQGRSAFRLLLGRAGEERREKGGGGGAAVDPCEIYSLLLLAVAVTLSSSLPLPVCQGKERSSFTEQ